MRSRPFGDDPSRIEWHPSPGAVDPASRLRRRYADAPAAALFNRSRGWRMVFAALPPIRRLILLSLVAGPSHNADRKQAGDNRREVRRAGDTMHLWTTCRDMPRPA